MQALQILDAVVRAEPEAISWDCFADPSLLLRAPALNNIYNPQSVIYNYEGG